MQYRTHLAIIIMLVGLTAALPCRADLTLDVVGTATFVLSRLQLEAGAGSNFVSAYETSAPQPTLSVTGASAAAWQVTVWLGSDAAWDSRLVLRVKRLDDDRGDGVSGGLSYLQPTDTPAVLFSGTGNQLAIPIQVELSGATCTMPVPLTPYLRNLTFRVSL